ncbi:MAG: DMT family transporter [Candidatus Thermoplasmatota archaeon]|nr:DMT family transporter [Candidatus Thermoplasmatota archaeon]
MNNKQIGVLAAICASVMWAIEPVFAKLSYQNSDFLHTSAIRAFIVMAMALAYSSATKASFRIDKRQISVMVYIGLAGTLFADLLYFLAMTKAPVINVVLLGHMQPIFIVLLGFLFLKEDRLIGIALMMLSGLLVTTRTPNNLAVLKLGTIWDLLVLASTITWATAAIAVRKYLKGMNAGIITFYRFLFASIVFMMYLLFTLQTFTRFWRVLLSA